MSSIPATMAMSQFTKDLTDVFSDRLTPTSFLRSFFPDKQSFTRYLSIQVKRNYENKAVDVMRGTEGNRNTFSKSTEKVIDPPYYREYFDLTELDLYDRLFGSTAIDAGIYSEILSIAADRLSTLKDKIDREYEYQCANVLLTGVVSLTKQTNIDFGRLSGSLVDKGGGAYWATGTVDPFADIAAGCTFLRQTGKSAGHVFNLILGSTAHADLYNNTIFKGRVFSNLSNSIDVVAPPQKDSIGGVFHGQITAGSYRVNLWTYPEYYDVSGTSTAYVDAKKVILVPEKPSFKLGFAAVPQVLRTGAGLAEDMELPQVTAAPYVIGDYVDQRNTAHIMEIKSAGVPIPTAVDQIYTLKVVS